MQAGAEIGQSLVIWETDGMGPKRTTGRVFRTPITTTGQGSSVHWVNRLKPTKMENHKGLVLEHAKALESKATRHQKPDTLQLDQGHRLDHGKDVSELSGKCLFLDTIGCLENILKQRI